MKRLLAVWVLSGCVGEGSAPVQNEVAKPAPKELTDAGGTSPAVADDGGKSMGDGAPSPPSPRCDPRGEFGPPTLVMGLSTTLTEENVWVSPDELHAYVTRRIGASTELHFSERSRVDEAFSAPAKTPLLATLNQEGRTVYGPTLSGDELLLYVYHYPTRVPQLLVASRGSKSDAFGNPAPLYFSNALAGSYLSPSLSSDGQTLFVQNLANPRIYRTTREMGGPQFFGALQLQEAPLTLPGLATQNHVTGALSAKGDVFVYGLSDGASDLDLYSVNATTTGLVGPPTKLTAVNSPQNERAGSFSGDGCALYFTSARTGDGDVYVTRRAPLMP